MFVSQMMAANQLHRGGGYGMMSPQQVDLVKFQNNLKGLSAPSASLKLMGPRSNKNWKGNKGNDKWNNNIRKDLPFTGVGGRSSSVSGNSGGSGAYNPPTLNELQQQNRMKARRSFLKKKFNHVGRSAPYAPRNAI
ncbi:hypothetical protein HanPI659440_Chr04g0153621 [Helianthus annuus]|nr:hypothetical protein HanPI659440_Chr04g0153621 [Helianthus annuus]